MSDEMSVINVSVHNRFEARALLREWDLTGQYAEQDIRFFTHDGRYLDIALWIENEFKHGGIF